MIPQRPKIAVIGAGNVGASVTLALIHKNLGHVTLADVQAGIPEGKALDLFEATPLLGIDAHIEGTTDLSNLRNQDIIIITAGIARKPGMSRTDLLITNEKILGQIATTLYTHNPDARIVVVTNPSDVMCHVVAKAGFPKNHIVGLGGVLDTARFRSFLAEATGLSVADIHALVLGGHGDEMVPLLKSANIGGVPISALLSQDKLQQLVERTRHGGAEIVAHLKSGSAYYAPAEAISQMVDAILLDRKRILPCSAYLDGQYGYRDIFLGVPVVLGKNGAERVIEVPLDETERIALQHSYESVAKLVNGL